MTKNELCDLLHFDQVEDSMNPYFFLNNYEEKGVIILMKTKKGRKIDLSEMEELCFQCPMIEVHEDVEKMVLFLFDKDNKIYDYSIAATKFKITRNEILKYEEMIGKIID
mgnify:CR=1 FL=1